MSDLSPELNLALAVDDDDTADYLDAPSNSLRSSLMTLDGLFNATTGHAHNGAHQGGALQFQDLTIGEDLTVLGATDLHGSVHARQNLTVDGVATLQSLVVNTTSHLIGAVTIDGAINSSGTLTIGQDLAVGRDLTVARNASIVGTLTAGAIGGATVTLTGGLSVGGGAAITGLLTAARVVIGGYDGGQALNISGNVQASGLLYQRSGAGRAWDNVDFVPAVTPGANTVVRRDSAGYIQQDSYMGYTGDIQPGSSRPSHVLGRNAGDNYMRWWPANAIGPPSVARYLMSTLTLPALSNAGGTANATVNPVSNSLGAAVAAGVITIPVTGWYSLAGGFKGNNVTGNTETMTVRLISSAKGVIDNADTQLIVNPSQFGGYFSYEGLLNAGETIRLEFHTAFDQINGTGELLLSFVPIADYPN